MQLCEEGLSALETIIIINNNHNTKMGLNKIIDTDKRNN